MDRCFFLATVSCGCCNGETVAAIGGTRVPVGMISGNVTTTLMDTGIRSCASLPSPILQKCTVEADTNLLKLGANADVDGAGHTIQKVEVASGVDIRVRNARIGLLEHSSPDTIRGFSLTDVCLNSSVSLLGRSDRRPLHFIGGDGTLEFTRVTPCSRQVNNAAVLALGPFGPKQPGLVRITGGGVVVMWPSSKNDVDQCTRLDNCVIGATLIDMSQYTSVFGPKYELQWELGNAASVKEEGQVAALLGGVAVALFASLFCAHSELPSLVMRKWKYPAD